MKREPSRRSPWIDSRIELVRLPHIRAYLQRRGWEERPPIHPGVLVFRCPINDDEGQPFDRVFPASDLVDDFLLRLESLIGTVASIEKRPATEVITDMLAGPSLNGPTRPHAQGADAAAS